MEKSELLKREIKDFCNYWYDKKNVEIKELNSYLRFKVDYLGRGAIKKIMEMTDGAIIIESENDEIEISIYKK